MPFNITAITATQIPPTDPATVKQSGPFTITLTGVMTPETPMTSRKLIASVIAQSIVQNWGKITAAVPIPVPVPVPVPFPFPAPTPTPVPAPPPATAKERGFPVSGPWVSFYGEASRVDLPKMAATYRIFDIDADPDMNNFTPANIKTLQNGGQNKVLSYFNLGSCENYRSYWASAPAGFLSCKSNVKAQRGVYSGYPDEVWMNVGDADYQHLIINYVAPRLVAQGIDGFYFDNFEMVEHGTNTSNGPCDGACSQGGLNLIAKLRDKYPNLLFVMQNATSNITRMGTAVGANGPVPFATLLDGVAHEEVFKPTADSDALAELIKWRDMNIKPGGRALWIGTLDYVGSCSSIVSASQAFTLSRSNGFQPSVSDASAGQQTICYWPATL